MIDASVSETAHLQQRLRGLPNNNSSSNGGNNNVTNSDNFNTLRGRLQPTAPTNNTASATGSAASTTNGETSLAATSNSSAAAGASITSPHLAVAVAGTSYFGASHSNHSGNLLVSTSPAAHTKTDHAGNKFRWLFSFLLSSPGPPYFFLKAKSITRGFFSFIFLSSSCLLSEPVSLCINRAEILDLQQTTERERKEF